LAQFFFSEKCAQGIRENMVFYHRPQGDKTYLNDIQHPGRSGHDTKIFSIIQIAFVISSTHGISKTMTPLNFFSYL
jgi:hypothetical protein